jgi:exonuclease III
LGKLPHILCFTEHHLRSLETKSVTLDNYTIAANYCRKQKQKGGACIYVKNNIISKSLHLETHSVDKDFEVCGVKLYLQGKKVYILTIYRSPSENFIKFMNQLETIILQIYKPKIDLIICGDTNINYLEESNRVKQLNTLFKTINLVNVSFPTRMQGSSSTSIDNIFIDNTSYSNYSILSLHNGLSDHEGQMLTVDIPTSLTRE